MNGHRPRRRCGALCATIAIVAAALTTGATPSVAQRVTGIVRDTGTSAPLAGAVVSTLDAQRQPISHAVADSGGRYFIALTESATQLRVQRIGFQPRFVALPSTREALMTVDLWMTKIPTLLSGVTVNDE